MSKKFSKSMFDTLKSTMQEQRGGGSFKDILKCEVGNSYRVRLIPNVKDIEKTSHHYYSHGWRSLATGNFVSCVCPTTYGERCAICEERIRLYRGDSEDKENAKLLSRKEQWLINAYIVDNPRAEEMNGSVKIIRYGKQLDTIINEAIDGDDAEEFGMRIFDLSEEGCDFRIKVDKNEGGYPTYVKSKFLRESEIDGMTEKKMEEVYENLFDLETVFEKKSPEEVKVLLDTHFHCAVTPTGTSEPDEDEDDTPSMPSVDEDKTDESSNDEGESDSDDVDQKLKDLMADL